jgi:hypothetical protein
MNMDTEPVVRWYKKLGENKYAQAKTIHTTLSCREK